MYFRPFGSKLHAEVLTVKNNFQTVKRRTDWVTLLGMVLFVAIVIGEVAVAIGVPLLVREEGVMAGKVTKLTTLELFDGTRSRCEDITKKAGSSLNKSEVAVIWEPLNILADYLREQVNTMSTRQFVAVQERVRKLRGFLNPLEKGKPYSERIELSTAAYLKKLSEEGR